MGDIHIGLTGYPKPWLLFWIAAIIAIGYMVMTFYRKWQSWSQSAPEMPAARNGNLHTVKIWFAEVICQRQLFGLSPFRWFVHALIFWGFTGLLFLSFVAVILKPLKYLGIDGGWASFFFFGNGHAVIKIWGDSFGLALLLGLLAAALRRLLIRPAQLVNNQIDIILVVFLLWLTISGFSLEGLHLALAPPALVRYSFVGRLFVPPGTFTKAQLQPWLTAMWTLHALSGVSLMAYLPHSKLMHSLLAPLVIAMNAEEEQDRKDIYWPDIKKHRATGSPRS
jgi:nitrate reductase gamma subunit